MDCKIIERVYKSYGKNFSGFSAKIKLMGVPSNDYIIKYFDIDSSIVNGADNLLINCTVDTIYIGVNPVSPYSRFFDEKYLNSHRFSKLIVIKENGYVILSTSTAFYLTNSGAYISGVGDKSTRLRKNKKIKVSPYLIVS